MMSCVNLPQGSPQIPHFPPFFVCRFKPPQFKLMSSQLIGVLNPNRHADDRLGGSIRLPCPLHTSITCNKIPKSNKNWQVRALLLLNFTDGRLLLPLLLHISEIKKKSFKERKMAQKATINYIYVVKFFVILLKKKIVKEVRSVTHNRRFVLFVVNSLL